ncbi:hypothetical protein K438DRAFT_1834188 [Mycena galopus ATCC 62051]|nr:hypothetical protein K438DRAFT_1834188 [Mycena galopus ATCC 62051]
MHGEDQTRHKSLGKRPRSPFVSHGEEPHSGSQRASLPSNNPSSATTRDSREQGAAAQTAGCSWVETVLVTEPSQKRRKIHVVHICVPEIEIKDEEESPELGTFFWPPQHRSRTLQAEEPPHLRSALAAKIQQHTPPPSPGSTAPHAVPASSSAPSAAKSQPCTPNSTPPRHLSTALPPTPPDSPLAEPVLSWPEEVTNVESYKLAAACTQELIDHYLRVVESEAGMLFLQPPSDEMPIAFSDNTNLSDLRTKLQGGI